MKNQTQITIKPNEKPIQANKDSYEKIDNSGIDMPSAPDATPLMLREYTQHKSDTE